MSTVIKVENISKQYRLGDVGTGAFAHDVNKWWHKVRGKENPYLKIGETNDRAVKGESDYVWALKDINFEVKQGEVLGIIGRNGAGKSTLLKILSKITTPTTGSIKIKGRIASLLEVGTGFHPELSGRDNIFLNGAILGMTKREIKSKFDEIVDFAGVERYIDTPVKRYSSGMYVRLAFGVAAHLEPEILIVDEVLAVGDAEFQKKALGKMKDVSAKDGRTVLFVSHNLSAIDNLCNQVILLNKGGIAFVGKTEEGIKQYINFEIQSESFITRKNNNERALFFTKYFLSNKEGNRLEQFNNKQNTTLNIEISINTPSNKYAVSYELININGLVIYCSSLYDSPSSSSIIWEEGKYLLKTELPLNLLKTGLYHIQLRSSIPNIEVLDEPEELLSFELKDFVSPIAKTGEGRNGVIIPVFTWEKSRLH